MKVHTTEQLTAWRLRHLDGESVADLAAEAGLRVNGLRRKWAERGITARLPRRDRVWRGWTMPQLCALHARWQTGETWASLAAEVGCPLSTLQAAVQRAGLPLRRHDGVPHIGGDWNDDRRKRSTRALYYAIVARADGLSWAEIHATVVRRYGYPSSIKTLRAHHNRWAGKHLTRMSSLRRQTAKLQRDKARKGGGNALS